ncbi:hypothetical protein ACFYM2_23990 [Streptomyces sp. NPDC006711]|uniref:hypothetical protein n=1 Tax=unclassified Streptomyces TaxID=2593676 RepID=UPI0033FB6CC0
MEVAGNLAVGGARDPLDGAGAQLATGLRVEAVHQVGGERGYGPGERLLLEAFERRAGLPVPEAF